MNKPIISLGHFFGYFLQKLLAIPETPKKTALGVFGSFNNGKVALTTI